MLPGLLWIIGMVSLGITYIGAPLASKKSGHNVSGIPGVAFFVLLVAGLVSPCKWLAFLSLLDFEITLLPIFWIIGKIKNKRDGD